MGLAPQFVAGGDIIPFSFVAIEATGTDGQAVQAGDADPRIIGISDGSNRDYTSALHAISGDVIRLQEPTNGYMRVHCGGTVDAGDRLASDAAGKAVAASAGEFQAAIALEDGADGKIIRCQWQPFELET